MSFRNVGNGFHSFVILRYWSNGRGVIMGEYYDEEILNFDWHHLTVSNNVWRTYNVDILFKYFFEEDILARIEGNKLGLL